MADNKLLTRNEIAAKDKWRIEDLFASDEAFKEALASFKEDMQVLGTYQGHLGDSPEKLLTYMQTREDILVRLDTLYAYAAQRSDEDTGNSTYQDLLAQTQTAMNQFYELLAFEDPELLSLPEGYIEKAISDIPDFEIFRHPLENTLRMKAHTLSKEEEALMALTGDMMQTPYSIFSMFNNADIRFDSVTDADGNEIPLSHGRFVPLLESSDRSLREKVFKTYYKTYDQNKNTLAAIYASNLKKDLFNAKARHYASSMESHLALNNIPTSVIDELIEAVHDALPEMYRYVSLRKKMLGLDDLHMYDVYAPLVSDDYASYTFEEAKEIVIEGLAPLGQEYIDLLTMGMNDGWIDVYENQGKRSGAYSGGDYAHHPYVLLNFQGNLDNVFTLAHEMGHSLHTWYANHTHNYSNACYSIFVAEIASTCNESLLIHHLLEKCTDPHEKLYLLNHYLDTMKGTIFRQTMFAEFEKITHRMVADGETLNAESICKVYGDLNALYFGPEMARDPEIALEWSRIPHFYEPFYVYQYATGMSAALALSSRILTEGEPAVKEYIDFLKAGGSDYPIEVLKKAGVDMTTKAPVASALKVFADTLDQAEAVIKELGY